MRVVLDTNIIVSALFWEHGNPHKIIDKALEGKFEFYTSEEILDELSEILKRDFDASEDFVSQTINFIKSFANIIESTERLDVVKSDVKDNKILECGIEAKASFVVSGDKHLLDIKEFREIKILTARDFIEVISFSNN